MDVRPKAISGTGWRGGKFPGWGMLRAPSVLINLYDMVRTNRYPQDDRVIYCNVHSVMYECSGVPTQFYM